MFIKHGDSIHTGMSMVLSKWIIHNPYTSRLNMRPVNRWIKPTYDHKRYDHPPLPPARCPLLRFALEKRWVWKNRNPNIISPNDGEIHDQWSFYPWFRFEFPKKKSAFQTNRRKFFLAKKPKKPCFCEVRRAAKSFLWPNARKKRAPYECLAGLGGSGYLVLVICRFTTLVGGHITHL